MKAVSLVLALLYTLHSDPVQQDSSLTKLCKEFNTLNTAIRDGKVEKQKAKQQFQKLIAGIEAACATGQSKDFYFPVQNHNASSVGGKNGNGFITGGYNYFDGNAHKGHAAHDIFISDKNQDCKDDMTNKKVNVLSVSEGVVIAVEDKWDAKSTLRGGKYIWIFSPAYHSLFYYAHNDTILVVPGQRLRAGQVIALVGRSGINAHKQRSPTHLHFMQLELDTNKLPFAVNPYTLLIHAKQL